MLCPSSSWLFSSPSALSQPARQRDWGAKVDVASYVELLRRLRRALGPSKLISVAMGNWSQLETVAVQAQALVDHINVMCYRRTRNGIPSTVRIT